MYFIFIISIIFLLILIITTRITTRKGLYIFNKWRLIAFFTSIYFGSSMLKIEGYSDTGNKIMIYFILTIIFAMIPIICNIYIMKFKGLFISIIEYSICFFYISLFRFWFNIYFFIFIIIALYFLGYPKTKLSIVLKDFFSKQDDKTFAKRIYICLTKIENKKDMIKILY